MRHVECKILYDIFQVHISVITQSDTLTYPDDEKFMIFNEEMEHYLQENEIPVVYQESTEIYYGMMQHENTQYIVGPITTRDLDRAELRVFQTSHHLKQLIPVKRMSVESLTKILTLLYWDIAREEISYDNVKVVGYMKKLGETRWNSDEGYETYQLDQSEYDRVHTGGIEFENRLLACVKYGEVAKIKKLLTGQIPSAYDYSEVAKNNGKQLEYLMISTLTLVTRAAVSGGMNPEEAYALGDVYMRRIEACRDNIPELTRIGMKAQLEFAEKVQIAKKAKTENIHVERCKDYIAKNLRKNIKVGDIAPNIAVSRTYLTHKFSELEGMTIQQYIMKEKCEHASNLLKYSDYPISTIAEYFGFASQSHFGSCFRKQFGVTPGEFRNGGYSDVKSYF